MPTRYTPKALEVLVAIEVFWRLTGYGPQREELDDLLKLEKGTYRSLNSLRVNGLAVCDADTLEWRPTVAGVRHMHSIPGRPKAVQHAA
jgi:hypothetical protein